MRFLFAFLIPLLACAQPVSTLPSAGEGPDKPEPETMTAIGFHDAVDWRCHQADYNENLVWIECRFDNTSATKTNEACIRIILLGSNGQEVVRSRLVCSSKMPPGTSYDNYAGFQNSHHTKVRNLVKEQCGPDTGRCKMVTREYPRE